jgi:hypothetical protein
MAPAKGAVVLWPPIWWPVSQLVSVSMSRCCWTPLLSRRTVVTRGRRTGCFARLVLSLTGSASPIEYRPLPADDPTRRRPIIDRAAERLGWNPEISVEEGVRRMIEWFASSPDELSLATT